MDYVLYLIVFSIIITLTGVFYYFYNKYTCISNDINYVKNELQNMDSMIVDEDGEKPFDFENFSESDDEEYSEENDENINEQDLNNHFNECLNTIEEENESE